MPCPLLRYEEMTDKMKAQTEKSIREEYANAAQHPEYRHFLKENFLRSSTAEPLRICLHTACFLPCLRFLYFPVIAAVGQKRYTFYRMEAYIP